MPPVKPSVTKRNQPRPTSSTGCYALDFGAILMLAHAMGALNPLLVDVLPEIEPIVVNAYAKNANPS
ncbi:MAG: hypothetical protein HC900_02225 [Methylacidiphilales bacterium]|nr:hypothetical protein [Candidatus Methylacidiphilales bacterium]